MRIQLALNVKDLDAAIDHYGRMFAAVPHKTRPGYANFEVTDPPLKLVLFENKTAAHELNHIGVEALDAAEFDAALARLQGAGFAGTVDDTVCCHARQDKLWIHGDNQLSWEWYKITDDAVDEASKSAEATTCCGETQKQDEVCCS